MTDMDLFYNTIYRHSLEIAEARKQTEDDMETYIDSAGGFRPYRVEYWAIKYHIDPENCKGYQDLMLEHLENPTLYDLAFQVGEDIRNDFAFAISQTAVDWMRIGLNQTFGEYINFLELGLIIVAWWVARDLVPRLPWKE
jgi:hypothetical protein